MKTLLLLAVCGLMACTTVKRTPTAADDPAAAGLAALPASYEGEWPCANCPGIVHRLSLYPDGAYFLSSTFRDRPAPATFHDIGSWVLSSDGSRLALSGTGQQPLYLQPLANGDLRKLDTEGQVIESTVNYTLNRLPTFVPVVPQLGMRGLFRYFADSAMFSECLTGQRWDVAQEGAYLELERDYLSRNLETGEDLLVMVAGRVELRPPMEGEGLRSTLVIEEFGGAAPRESCPPRFINRALQGSQWVLQKFGAGEASPMASVGERAPDLRLDTAGQVTGFSGCNRYTGAYAQAGTRLTFSPLAATRMGCAQGMDAERALLAALEQTAGWRITGAQLELLNSTGQLLAVFTAHSDD